MNVSVDIAGEETHDVSVADDDTYADLLAPIDLNPHEVAIMVDGRTVPGDQRIETDRVRVVRLIKGG